MIIVLRTSASPEAAEKIAARVTELGMKPHVIVGTDRTVVAAAGKESENLRDDLLAEPDVEAVHAILAPYKIASLETKAEPTVVTAKGLTIGGGTVGVIGGPCSVEGEEAIHTAAKLVKEAGATGLRGGAFKPRTSPYSFQGLKEEGLKYLRDAGEATGLATVTEVMAPHDVDLVASYADVLQIGARNMQNYTLLEAVGKCDKPVILKRGASATVDEFLLAAEYILDGGNTQVALCERGIRTFEGHTRFTLPLATVPYLQQKTHLPVVIDPSHGTGVASLVPPMIAAAVAAGCDGLLVETHPDPPRALSDGAQSLTPQAFAASIETANAVAGTVGKVIG
ncbi:MAG: 3-deoxy-7-phosphoheptulonate synthase [Planctomycetota bacterium]